MEEHSRRKVCYYYDNDIGNFHYGRGHPMKPHRVRVTHNLLVAYGLYQKLEIYRPHKAMKRDMTKFHSPEYINFLSSINIDNLPNSSRLLNRFNVGEDSPVFDGLFEFCQLSAGGSLAAAVKLNHKQSDICINWGGGLHHAKKSEASGFCYVNDIVLAILELLKHNKRILYIDIDVHHGDGVEEAFYTTDRVMTVSFHKFGEYFPGTGGIAETGSGPGKNYSVNFPLHDGITDEAYESIFVPVIQKIMEVYQPSVIVLQCGADSLAGDRLGCFNLSTKGHGKCVSFCRELNVPLLLVGGGGYTVRNVARCWTYETSLALNVSISNDMPYNDYFEYFSPSFNLHINEGTKTNLNNKKYLKNILERVLENLRNLNACPSVQVADVPMDIIEISDEESKTKDDDEDNKKDVRKPQLYKDKHINPENEFFDSSDEADDVDVRNSGSNKSSSSPSSTSTAS